MSDLTLDAIRTNLATRTFGRTIHLLDKTPSTNSAALALAQEGAEDGTVVVADQQTAGRGRLGRGWHSPPGGNLYCSVILRRTGGAEDRSHWLSWVPLAAGVAVVHVVRNLTRLRPSLKWPNDILVGHKKVGGILCEGTGTNQASACIVVGIGINVNTDPHAFPDELREQATSLAAEAGRPIDRPKLLTALLLELETSWEELCAGKVADLAHDYGELCSTLGRPVRVTLAGGAVLEGRALCIGRDGSLHLMPEEAQHEPEGGTPVVVHAGDVVHLR